MTQYELMIELTKMTEKSNEIAKVMAGKNVKLEAENKELKKEICEHLEYEKTLNQKIKSLEADGNYWRGEFFFAREEIRKITATETPLSEDARQQLLERLFPSMFGRKNNKGEAK